MTFFRRSWFIIARTVLVTFNDLIDMFHSKDNKYYTFIGYCSHFPGFHLLTVGLLLVFFFCLLPCCMGNLFFLYMTLKWCPLHCSMAVPNQFGEEGHNCMIIWCCKSFSFNKDKIFGLLETVSYIKLVTHLRMNTSPNEVYWKFMKENYNN